MTCYLSLPLFYENLQFNRIFSKYIKLNPQVKRFDFMVESCHGSFSYCSWNGDLNSNFGNLQLDKDFFTTHLNYQNLLRYDFSNILLEEEDFFDVHANMILKEGENGSNQIELCNLKLMNYIKEKYPQYTFVFSKNADLINPLNASIINTIIEQDIFLLISLPSYFNKKIELLKEIKKKNYIELTVGSRCKCDEEKIKSCRAIENFNQINFNKYSLYQDCAIENKYRNYNEIEEEIKDLQKLGFNHFKIDTPAYIDLKEFNLYLIHSLIKPQYHLEILQLLKGVL